MPAKPQTPSAKIMSESNPIRTIRDADDRTISWRRMSVLDQARMMRAVGAEYSNNTAFMTIAMIACMVVEIDGVPSLTPKTLPQIDAAIERLGDKGYNAVSDDLVIMVAESEGNVEQDVKN